MDIHPSKSEEKYQLTLKEQKTENFVESSERINVLLMMKLSGEYKQYIQLYCFEKRFCTIIKFDMILPYCQIYLRYRKRIEKE